MMLFDCPSLIVNIQLIFQPGVGRFNTLQLRYDLKYNNNISVMSIERKTKKFKSILNLESVTITVR